MVACFQQNQLVGMSFFSTMSSSSYDSPDLEDTSIEESSSSQTFSRMADLACEDYQKLSLYLSGSFMKGIEKASALNKEGREWLRDVNEIGKTTKDALDAATNLAVTVYAARPPASDEVISSKDRNDRADIEHEQTINKIKEARGLVSDLDTCIQNAPFTIESIRGLIRICKKDKGVQPKTRKEIRELHTQNIALNSQNIQMTRNIAEITSNGAQMIRSGAFIAATAQQMLESPQFEHKMTHTKNNMVKTFGSITCMTVGGILLYKHLMNHVDQKSTILASIGAGLITVPWLVSYIDR